jgi:hypothetical protein
MVLAHWFPALLMLADGASPSTLHFDFERDQAGQPPGPPWVIRNDAGKGVTDRGSIQVDASKAASGKQSVHVVVPPGKRSVLMRLKGAGFFPPPKNEYWGRMMWWAGSHPEGTAHWMFLRSQGPVPNASFTAEYTLGSEGKRLITNYDSEGKKSDCWKFGGDVVTKKWICVEWHMKGASNEIQMWMDGVPDKSHVVGKGDGCIKNELEGVWQAPTFTTLELGYEIYGNKPGTHEFWFDDVAVSGKRIGCPKP